MSHSPANPANLLTLMSVASAALGLCAPQLGWSPAATDAAMVSCVALSLLLDRLDGPLARRLGTSSELGARLDSLADLLAFAALPAVMLVRAADGSPAALAVALAYVLTAVWRLARYDGDELTATRWGPAFRGVPTPAAASAVLVAVVLAPSIAPWLAAIAAALMPSRLRYPKRGPGAWPWLVLVPIAVVVALARLAAPSELSASNRSTPAPGPERH